MSVPLNLLTLHHCRRRWRVSAASFFSDVLSTSSVSSRSGPDMNSFASPRSGGLQRSFSPSQNRASFYPEYYHPPTLIRPHIYKCAFAAAKCRLPSDNIPQHFLDTPGTIWVNKIPLVESLCPVISQLGNWLALIRRPSGYGKTAFIYTSGFLHDVLNERTAAHVFGPRASSFPYVRGDRLVLRIDLQTVFYDTSETMCSSVDAYLNAVYYCFLHQYAEKLDLSDADEIRSYICPQATHTFDEILVSPCMLKGHFLTIYSGPSHLFGSQTCALYRQLQLATIELNTRELQ
ncbi:hypothetical protein BDZ89DRAFT_1164601 [Hymenopellis radicata]|nr:hypothetical protein BDZ89DRAFT_1164601 [Hymenopellis radicata]